MPHSPLLLRRFGAMLYDLVVLAALWMTVAALALLVVHGEVDVAHPSMAWKWSLRAALALVSVGYFALSWHRGGQTIGMRAWRLRITRADGRWPGLGCGAWRALLAALSLTALGAGFWWAWFDRDGLTVHDRLAGTIMTRLPRQP